MKKVLLINSLVLIFSINFGQYPGYYNGTEGKSGTELKTALHEIIKDHVDFSYSDAKFILNYADEDPNNTNNVILFYTKRSQSKESYGSGPNDINREHVWAKSHGNFADVRPMDGDAHNLHPTDASVNMTKSNYDFDECTATGTYLDEADAWYTTTQFEPADATKGEVARTIFYMAVRYEGTEDEIDLETVDAVGTYPLPQHGKLSSLLEWNRDFPPTDLERRRNERVYEAQRNRNPFIDNPEFADLIWEAVTPSEPNISDLTMTPDFPSAGSQAELFATVPGAESVTLYYGKSFDSEEYSSTFSSAGDDWSGEMDLSTFIEGEFVHYKIVASGNGSENISWGSFVIPETKTLTPISDVQGIGNSTPLNGSIVSIGGIVTANLDNTFYLQSGNDLRNAICVFDIKRGKIGDSVVVTGRAIEYNNLTELDNVSYLYNYGPKEEIEPVEITLDQVNEDYEGMLVKFQNVTFLEGDTEIPYDEQTILNLTDGDETIDVYVRYNSRLGGKVVPAGIVNVTAVVSQYQGNYQLLINDIDDIEFGDDNAPPLIGNVIVNDASWIEIQFSEKLDKVSAENTANYSIDGDVSISGAYLYNNTSVLLLVTGLQAQSYTLTVSGVTDLQGNAISNASFNFESEFSSGTGIKLNKELIGNIYPNPATKKITVDLNWNSSDSISVSILDMKGRQIPTADPGFYNSGIEIDVSKLEDGYYILQLETSEGYYHKIFAIKR